MNRQDSSSQNSHHWCEKFCPALKRRAIVVLSLRDASPRPEGAERTEPDVLTSDTKIEEYQFVLV